MTTCRVLLAAIGAAFAFVACIDVSLAQQKNAKPKKLTLEQAWKVCKAEVDKSGTPGDWSSQRYSVGGACMARYGYKL